MIDGHVQRDLRLPRRRAVVSAAALAVGLTVALAIVSLSAACWAAPAGDPGAKPAAAAKPANASARRVGKLIRMTLPITAGTVDRVERFIRRAVEKITAGGAQPVLIFEFVVPPDQAEYAGRTEFSDALKLARLLSGKQTAGAWTVAYVPESIPGHAVLAALACDDIVMPSEAEFGPVDAKPDEVGPTERSAYREIADRRKTIPPEVALWLLEPSREVLKVETEVSREYVTAEGLAELSKRRTIQSQEPLSKWIQGRPGQLSGNEARQLGFVRYLVTSPEEVAKRLDLRPEAMVEDPALVGDWRAVRVDLKGPITADSVGQVQRMIEEQTRLNDANFICLWIDSPGGSPGDSIRLSGYLASLDRNKIRTVAYIPAQARSDAALVALACHDVLINANAELGGSGATELNSEDIHYATQAIGDEQGPWKSRSRSLIAAMIDPKLAVFRYTRADTGAVAYFSDEEFDRLRQQNPDAGKWQKGLQVTRPDEELLLTGNRAVEYGLADRTAGSFAELRQVYGLENDPTLLEPGWAAFLIDALASPGVAALLLTIAFIAVYAELHTPGIGMGGFIAAVCFLLFFWSHYLGGTAGWLEISLFLAGVCFLLLEIFIIPGFGIFGLGGGCLILVSVVLASQTFVVPHNAYQFAQLQRSLLTVTGAGAAMIVAAVVLRRFLPETALFSQLLLKPPAGQEAQTIRQREAMLDLRDFVGKQGITTTQLTPGGKARFDDTLLDVMADGELIQRGTRVEIVEVHGSRVVVRAVEKS